jgi:hypothetical protein
LNNIPKQYHSSSFISIILVIGTTLLFVGGPDYHSARSLKHLWDLGHIVYFALLTLLLCRWRVVATMPLTAQWIALITTTVLIGVSIELLQYGTSRTPNTGDLVRDLSGSLLVLVLGPPGRRLRAGYLKLLLRTAVLLLMLTLLWPLTRSLIDEAIARYQFPLLSGFETPFELDRWQGDAGLGIESSTPLSSGKWLKLSLSTAKYSGAALKYFDGDWSSNRSLSVRFYNPDTSPLQITCRIHDLNHVDGNEEYTDRFNRRFKLVPGWNRIVIDLDEVKQSPDNRNMDMRRIRGVMFFAVSLPAPRVIYLDKLMLTD